MRSFDGLSSLSFFFCLFLVLRYRQLRFSCRLKRCHFVFSEFDTVDKDLCYLRDTNGSVLSILNCGVCLVFYDLSPIKFVFLFEWNTCFRGTLPSILTALYQSEYFRIVQARDSFKIAMLGV